MKTCFLCTGQFPDDQIISVKDDKGPMDSCRSCFDDAMNGDTENINIRRETMEAANAPRV